AGDEGVVEMISNNKAYRMLVGKARKYECELSGKIQKAVDASDLDRAAKLLMRYLSSFYCKLIALEKAYKKMRRRNRPKVTDPESLAKNLDAIAGSKEVAKILMMPREDHPDHPRPVWAFGIEQRALQQLVAGALGPFAKLADNQFLMDGGVQAAIKSVLQFLAEGYTAVVEVDIKSCYSSYNGEEIHKLFPYLPEAVVKKVILSKYLPISLQCSGLTIDTAELQGEDGVAPDTFSEVLAEAQLGIPQGSSVSPLVSDMLLATALNTLSLPAEIRLVVYADNFLILAKSEEAAATAAHAVGTVLLDHPAGPLSSKVLHDGWASEGFTYLGHTFKFSGTTYYVEPSAKNRQKFQREYEKRLKEAMNDAQSIKKQRYAIARLERLVRSWAAAFRLWDGVDEWRLERLTYVRSLKKKIQSKAPIIPSATE
ncbi:reverse transcriptase domain-containing protein, partial [Pseudomonadota bacterium]